MPDALNLNIALAKQAYDELVGIRSVADLERNDFGTGPTRERIAALLKKLKKWGRIYFPRTKCEEEYANILGDYISWKDGFHIHALV